MNTGSGKQRRPEPQAKDLWIRYCSTYHGLLAVLGQRPFASLRVTLGTPIGMGIGSSTVKSAIIG